MLLKRRFLSFSNYRTWLQTETEARGFRTDSHLGLHKLGQLPPPSHSISKPGPLIRQLRELLPLHVPLERVPALRK